MDIGGLGEKCFHGDVGDCGTGRLACTAVWCAGYFPEKEREIRSRDTGRERNFFYLIMLQAESKETKGREAPRCCVLAPLRVDDILALTLVLSCSVTSPALF